MLHKCVQTHIILHSLQLCYTCITMGSMEQPNFHYYTYAHVSYFHNSFSSAIFNPKLQITICMHSNDAIYKLFWFNWLCPHPFRLCFINGNLSGCQCKYTKPPKPPSDYCSTRMVELCCWRSLTISLEMPIITLAYYIFYKFTTDINHKQFFTIYNLHENSQTVKKVQIMQKKAA